MLKKSLAVCFLVITSTSYAIPHSLYVAPTLSYANIKVDNVRNEALNPQLGIGFGDLVREDLYFGMEAFGVLKSMSHNNSTNNNPSLNSYGASILPGIPLDNTLLGFMRLGVVNTHFDSYDEDKSGIQVGLGLQAMLNTTWSIRGEYIYTRYQRIDTLGAPATGQYSLGAVYRF
jgi:opacity protein-like surface antigen